MASDADVRSVLTLLAALGCGLISGVSIAFSAFVLRALARLPAIVGIAAMHAINVAGINRVPGDIHGHSCVVRVCRGIGDPPIA